MRVPGPLIVAVLLVLSAQNANAGDAFTECAIPNSHLVLDHVPGGSAIELYGDEGKVDFKTLRKITISQKEGTCTHEGETYYWSSHDFLFEIEATQYSTKEKLLFLCFAYQNGAPENVGDCELKTTKERTLVPAYSD